MKGMRCSHCKSSIEKNLIKIESISSVEANPERNLVVIEANKDLKTEIETVINSLGYEFVREE